MSRIGNKAISIPAGVTVTVADNNVVTVKGPKGELTAQFNSELLVYLKDLQKQLKSMVLVTVLKCKELN